jgi:hypothetical protein
LIVAAFAGGLLGRHQHRVAALAFLLISALGLLTFSEIAGFSIGRMTALIPVLITGYIGAMGRGKKAVSASLMAATLLYLAFSWLLTPFVSYGGVWGAVFGSWGILLYAIASVGAFGWAMSRPPKEA